MVQQITKGIKISVANRFEGSMLQHYQKTYAFSYTIKIENQSAHTVQLLSRKWIIKDALNQTEHVEGDGVIGMQPVLKPGETHTYSSGCLLQAPMGSMQGHYLMSNIETGNQFKVSIPIFKLNAAFAMN